ncbi:MAG: outer membrane protein assembly factor BamE [Colwellia sp.]|jgi:outer membrane protein assembly factor BamE|uniref:outer membrane protein assembly factor BamE n=1 Tax=Colwellia sp. Bg11-12 TaxID=2759817 RepID=UPI0015F56D5F|nr:outer membrane protein assembly factor BamE [Colwellia sp. Bg11-12]MBA6262170.1 outer membrane protein assembly factor BamE [Colwellia sp. Bg11-12]
MLFRILALTIALSLSACSSWVFRIDIPQGNFLEQKDIDKLQIGMSKEQVKFVLGSPVVVDAFNNDTWHYIYSLKSGRSEELNIQKKFILSFDQDSLISAEGDFELAESFYVPMVN